MRTRPLCFEMESCFEASARQSIGMLAQLPADGAGGVFDCIEKEVLDLNIGKEMRWCLLKQNGTKLCKYLL